MSDIFISYAREDRPRVERLAAALAQRGWTVWWDPAIRTGEDFGRMIHTALQATRCVMVVWSYQSIVSPWVQDEAPVGLERGVRRHVEMPSHPRWAAGSPSPPSRGRGPSAPCSPYLFPS